MTPFGAHLPRNALRMRVRRLTRPFRRKIVRLSDVVKGEGTEDGVVRGYVTRVLR